MAERKRRKQTRKDAQKRTLAGVAILLVCSLAVIFAVRIMILRTIGSYDQDITVHLKGGTVIIRYQNDGTVIMTGDAKTVFQGSVEL